jgi:hypothetical protein
MRCDRHCRRGDKGPWDSPWDDDYPQVPLMLPLSAPHFCTRLHTPRRSLDFQYAAMPAEILDDLSRHHALILQTAPRPASTLDRTLASLKEAKIAEWRGSRILCSDGPLHVDQDHDGWHAFDTCQQLGSAKAFIRALRMGLSVDPDLETLTFIEDDVELCQNALPYMSRVAIPEDVAFISWFTYDYDWATPRHAIVEPHPSVVAAQEKRGILGCRSSRYFILTQACTFPRRTVDRLLDCPHIAELWPRRDGHDCMISWALGDALYAVHFPVLAQHMGGLQSAVALARGDAATGDSDAQAGSRQSPYYAGRDFDALSLMQTGG